MSEYVNTQPHELGWDDEISNEGQFVLLEDGDYNFTVKDFERARFPGSAKIPPCNKAALTLSVNTPDGEATIKYDLILYSSLEWKLCEFFRAIGQKKHGEKVAMNWSRVKGARGRARITTREYTKKDGSTGKANDVEKFYDYDPNFFSAGNDWVAAAQSAPPVSSGPRWQQGTF